MKAEEKLVRHILDPICFPDSRVLILGTMPSPKSRENMFYYAHPANRFWRVLYAVFDEPFAVDRESRIDLLRRRHIALWDVLESCIISGASDGSIKRPVANDICALICRSRIETIFTTGLAAYRLYCRLCLPSTGIEAVSLPSTSPANASTSLGQLTEAYAVIRKYLPEES